MHVRRWIAAAVLASLPFLPLGAAAQSCPAPVCTAPPAASQLQNLDLLKAAIKAYYASGRYTAQAAAVEAQAARYIDQRVAAGVKKPAIVFDIDDTALLTLGYELMHNFAYNKPLWDAYAEQTGFPAIAPTLALARHAQSRGVAVMFVTGRPTTQASMTAKNLARVGYTYTHLYLRPPNDHRASIIPFKSAERAAIQALGYTVLETIGDQFSDLEGGHAEREYKLPNPLYYIP
jgi:predicted secreted acid phosphatase